MSEPAPGGLGVVRGWALLDLGTGLLLLLPPGASQLLGALDVLAARLPGSPRLDPAALGPLGMFFCNLAGALALLWALVRLARPSRFLGLADATARLGVALLIAAHVGLAGLPWSLALFVLSELCGALHQGWALNGRRVPRPR